MEEVVIHEDERVDDLQCGGLRLIQKKTGFRFGVDAVLLANFADVRPRDGVIDLGTGTGIIPVLLAGKTEAARLVGLEIQPDMAEMAGRSVILNALSERVEIICGDIRNSADIFNAGEFRVVTANPPYMKAGGGLLNPLDTKAISRHEIACTLEDVVKAAAKLLTAGGQLAMVHRPERLVDIACAMRGHGIEPKYLRLVHPSPHKKPNLVLIKGLKGGRAELKMLEPLYVYDDKGRYTEEINRIYKRQKPETRN